MGREMASAPRVGRPGFRHEVRGLLRSRTSSTPRPAPSQALSVGVRQAHVGIRPEPLTHPDQGASSGSCMPPASCSKPVASFHILLGLVRICVTLGQQCLVPEVLTSGAKLGERNKGWAPHHRPPGPGSSLFSPCWLLTLLSGAPSPACPPPSVRFPSPSPPLPSTSLYLRIA